MNKDNAKELSEELHRLADQLDMDGCEGARNLLVDAAIELERNRRLLRRLVRENREQFSSLIEAQETCNALRVRLLRVHGELPPKALELA
jgi:uncharacterized membrane protein